MNNIVWKDPNIELPAEACHYPELWCSQQVLTRTLYETTKGVKRYQYHIAWYNFELKRFLDFETEKIIDIDEWTELEIFA